MLAIIGASGKIGGATLSALLTYNLLPPSQIIALTSSTQDLQTWSTLSSKGIQVRYATFDDPSSMETALSGCSKLFLVSSPRIKLDYDPVVPAPPGQGREGDHFVVLDAAEKAGVKHIYYTSLAFGNPSKSNVMTAHERTEARLRELERRRVFDVTILREGLYNESWPLYLGYFKPKSEERKEIVLADEGGGKINWTGINDLGIANAMIVAENGDGWKGKCVYLSKRSDPRTMAEIAQIVGKYSGKEINLRTVNRDAHVKHYVEDMNMNERAVKWWAATYDAIKDGECLIQDSTFDNLLAKGGVAPTPVEETIKEMLRDT